MTAGLGVPGRRSLCSLVDGAVGGMNLGKFIAGACSSREQGYPVNVNKKS